MESVGEEMAHGRKLFRYIQPQKLSFKYFHWNVSILSHSALCCIRVCWMWSPGKDSLLAISTLSLAIGNCILQDGGSCHRCQSVWVSVKGPLAPVSVFAVYLLFLSLSLSSVTCWHHWACFSFSNLKHNFYFLFLHHSVSMTSQNK
jgi:hypothetical protein